MITCTNFRSTWAQNTVTLDHACALAKLTTYIPHHHWSRIFEYPWVYLNSTFTKEHLILDAGGGESNLQYCLARTGCEVYNVDNNSELITYRHPNIHMMQGDIQQLVFPDGMFHRVLCISTLEHLADPVRAIHELWRVLAPGGALLVTMDVISKLEFEFHIDRERAGKLLGLFGKHLPTFPLDALHCPHPVGPAPGKAVDLSVLCFRCDKPVNQ